MKGISSFTSLMCLSLLMNIASVNEVNGGSVPPSIYVGKMLPFGEYGIFELSGDSRITAAFPERYFFRLWGVNVASETLENAIGSALLTCTVVGEVESNAVGSLRIVDCRSKEHGNISRFLIQERLSQPLCSERPLIESEDDLCFR